MKRWLQIFMARKGIVAAHIHFQYLEEGIQSLLDNSAGDDNLKILRPLDLQGRIISLLLHDLESDQPRWPLMKQYLQPSEEPVDSDEKRWSPVKHRSQHLRIFQLSRRITDLFTNYEYHRFGTLEEWRDIQPAESLDIFTDTSFNEDFFKDDKLFQEQRDLYRAATVEYHRNHVEHCPSEPQPESIPISEYARRRLQAKNPPGEGKKSTSIYLFGLSFLSRYHISLLRHLSDYYNFRFYLPDLVPEVFEASTDRSGQWTTRHFRSELRLNDHNLKNLNKWKKPFAGLLQLIHAAFQGRVEWYGRNSDRNYPLGRFHDALLKYSELRNEDIVDHIHIGSCPGELREIETIYQCILQAMKDDPTLELTDIAVLIPDIEHYRPFILNVFERDRTETDELLIPYNLSDYSAARESYFASGVRTLFKLIRGDFTRSAVFELLYNPLCQHAAGLDPATVAEWLRLFDDVNIRRFFDESDRCAQVGTPTDGARADAFTFLRGLRSLYLGLFLDPDDILDDGLRPHSLFLVDKTSLLKLIDLIQSLYHWLQLLKKDLEGAERLEKTLQFIDTFISIPPSENGEEEVRNRMRSELRLYDVRLFKHFTILEQAILETLTGIPGSRGQYLTGGVTICSLQPMRPVPFRHIYIAGLGEEEFSLREDRSTLNLLSRDRSRSKNDLPQSDITTGEKARLLLFESLLSATDRIVILYNGRDTQRDRELLPCSPLSELISDLKAILRKPEELVKNLPLKLYSRTYLSRNSDLFANFSARDIRLLNEGCNPNPTPLASPISVQEEKRKAEPALPAVVRVDHLIQFLNHPVKAVLKRHMHLYDSQIEDDSNLDDEPFHITNEEIWDVPSIILKRALLHIVEQKSAGRQITPEKAIESAISSVRQDFADRMPFPPYDEIALAKYRLQKDDSVNFSRLLDTALPIIEKHAFSSDLPDKKYSIALNVNGRTVRLTGELPFLAYKNGDVTVLYITEKESNQKSQNRILFPLLFQLLVLERLRDFQWNSFTIYLIMTEKKTKKEKQPKTLTYKTNPQRTVRPNYLEELISDYLAGDLRYLPFNLKLLGEDMWEPGFFQNANPGDIQKRLEEEYDDSEEDSMQLLRLIRPQIDENMLSTIKKRWEPIVTLAVNQEDRTRKAEKSSSNKPINKSRNKSSKSVKRN